jgi:hypothetical protein
MVQSAARWMQNAVTARTEDDLPAVATLAPTAAQVRQEFAPTLAR